MAALPYNSARWQRLRLAHLSLFPMCQGCEAMQRLTLANTVDHRVDISANWHGSVRGKCYSTAFNQTLASAVHPIRASVPSKVERGTLKVRLWTGVESGTPLKAR